nr:glycoside hydrolase family 43 protein [Bacteroides gallinarum]
MLPALSCHLSAQNPIIQTKFTADPAPLVYNDTVYLYTTHDDDEAVGFLMKEWLLYTSTDMVNWTDCGPVASLKDFIWTKRENGAWAPQVIERDGKFYMYCPVHGNGIGVLVSDSPYGPFKDPIGKPLVWQKEHWEDIDPTVFIDDDGQAYLYWGNPNLYYVKLNKDMVSYSGDVVKCDVKPEDYQEGPWFYKREGKYYMAYASTCCPEGIGYAMSDSPTGPWRKTGTIMDHNPRSNGNHPGIIDFKGKSYLFGFNYDIHKAQSDIHCERRSICVAEFKYNTDGTIDELAFWDKQKVTPVTPLNPYRRVEAETMAWSDGVKTAKDEKTGVYVTDIHNTDYIKVRSVDFGKGASSFEACVASMYREGSIELRLDSPKGKLIGVCQVGCTGGKKNWKLKTCTIEGATGVHDLYLIFVGKGKYPFFYFDWWQFKQ